MKSFKMNWAKYTLDEWLVQFGAWCNSCRMKSGHSPDSLRENMINKLMIETGYKYLPRHKNTVECKISDDEALAVQKLILDVFKKVDGEMKQAVQYLYAHKVDGHSLRRVADYFDVPKDAVSIKIYGAKYYILGRYHFIRIT